MLELPVWMSNYVYKIPVRSLKNPQLTMLICCQQVIGIGAAGRRERKEKNLLWIGAHVMKITNKASNIDGERLVCVEQMKKQKPDGLQ